MSFNLKRNISVFLAVIALFTINSMGLFSQKKVENSPVKWTSFPTPVRFDHISTEQGLSQSSVSCILQDRKGFMWFGTDDGLNRYNGYRFNVYKNDVSNPKTSLSNNKINCILEDREGNIWVGGRGGLFDKFDYEMERFIHFGTPSKPSKLLSDSSEKRIENNVGIHDLACIYEDRAGIIWIGTYGEGLKRFIPPRSKGQPAMFMSYTHDPENPKSLNSDTVETIYQDRQGNLWLGTDNGVNLALAGQNPDSNLSFIKYSNHVNDFIDPSSPRINRVREIVEDNQGHIWIGSDTGLFEFDWDKKKFACYIPNPSDPNSLSFADVSTLYKDRSGTIWIGTAGGGLNKLIPASVNGNPDGRASFVAYKNNPNSNSSLFNDSVLSLYEDYSGVLWVGLKTGGICKLPLRVGSCVDREKPRFLHYFKNTNDLNSLSHNFVSSLIEDRRGTLWVATYGGGITHVFPGNSKNSPLTFVHYKHDPKNPSSLNDNKVFYIFEDKHGNIWVGTRYGGLSKVLPGDYRNSPPKFIHYMYDQKNPRSLNDNFVTSISEDHSGHLWVGTSRGLNRFDNNVPVPSFTSFKKSSGNPRSLSSDSILCILADRSEVIWVGTDDGLNRFNKIDQSFTRYMPNLADPSSINSNIIFCIFEDKQGNLWFGTGGGGLNKLDSRRDLNALKFIHYTRKDGLLNEVINSIQEDNNGNLWLSTNQGLTCFDPKTSTFKNFDQRYGLQSNEFNSGASLKAKSGELFFGGINGYNVFDPEHIWTNRHVPSVAITDFQIMNQHVQIEKEENDSHGVNNSNTVSKEMDFPRLKKSIILTKEIEIPLQYNIITFEFAALDYACPERNRYAYILEGLDHKWTYPGNTHSVTYTALPPGKFTFRVKASNNDGVWNETGVSIRIKIIPPFWREVWFLVSAVLILIFSAFAGYRYRVNLLKKRKKELEFQIDKHTCDLKTANKELKKLSIVASKTDNAVAIMDSQGNIEWVNERFSRMYGMSLEEYTAVFGPNIIDSQSNPNIDEIVNKCIHEKKPISYEFSQVTEDNKKEWYQRTLTPIIDSQGQLGNLVAIDSNITRIKESEEAAEAANQAKSEFLARMSHEIRTPMNAIIGFTDMLLESGLNDEQIDYTRTIYRSGESLITLLNDILDFSKIEAGELAFDPIDFDPEVTIFDICELIQPRLGNKQIEIICRIGNNVPAYVKSDAGRFRQVILNLLGNAIKFTEAGEIEVSINVEEREKNRIKLHTQVRDTGIGIPEDKLDVIFDVFQQADGSITRKFGGTGLGLAICRQISHLMDGEVWAESELGKGSIFHFTAWVEKSNKLPEKEFAREYLTGKHVLVVDDNSNNLEILNHVLTAAQMRVYSIRFPEETVPAIHERFEMGDPFDIGIIDVQMPITSGYDVAKKIRKLPPPLCDIPLLAFTSSTLNRSSIFKEAGFDGFLPKPIQQKRLLKMLERMLGKKAHEEKREIAGNTLVTRHSVIEEAKHAIHILLAEDNPINQKLVQFMLSKAGYQLTLANNGTEAISIYTSDPGRFDLILMDIQMPGMDGRQASTIIRNKGFTAVPIIALTAESMKGDREKCLEAGMSDYISKPIRREQVFQMVKKWVLHE